VPLPLEVPSFFKRWDKDFETQCFFLFTLSISRC
jgi:hypothetical protein